MGSLQSKLIRRGGSGFCELVFGLCPRSSGVRVTAQGRERVLRAPRHLKLSLLLVGALLAGCAQIEGYYTKEGAQRRPTEVRVLLMPPDIELSELSAGGALEPKADWTQAAKGHISAALTAALQPKRGVLIPYQPPMNDPVTEASHTGLVKLHDAVGMAILVHQYNRLERLPTKGGRFEWSLGPGVQILQQAYSADCALFIFLRDSYASAGRVALIVGAALLGVGVPGGRQIGFASLVDLQNGDIVWFNRLFSATGDLRTPEPARQAVRNLLDGLPL